MECTTHLGRVLMVLPEGQVLVLLDGTFGGVELACRDHGKTDRHEQKGRHAQKGRHEQADRHEHKGRQAGKQACVNR